MAGSLINTLYPPYMDTFMPAFVYDDPAGARIDFSISPYNDVNSIEHVHVTLVDQATNRSALRTKSGKIIDGIYFASFKEEVGFNKDTGLYYIMIPPTALKSEVSDSAMAKDPTLIPKFGLERYYQAQIRFDNVAEKDLPTSKKLKTHFIQNRAHFSEWSNVTLLRAIPRPVFSFKNLDLDTAKVAERANELSEKRWTYELDKSNADYEPEYYNKGLVPINATIKWQTDAPETYQPENEYLSSYKITIYPYEDRSNSIVQTEWIHVGNKERNSINYVADMNRAKEDNSYIIHIDAVTRNGYEWWDEREIMIMRFNATPFKLQWDYETVRVNANNFESDKILTDEDGIVYCTVTSTDNMPPGYLYIYRSSSLDNYKSNEIIQVTAENGYINRTFIDQTPASLISYRYKAQYHIDGGTWTMVQKSPVYIYPQFYDMLFLRQNKQLAIRFDAEVSSLTPTVNRAKIDTLGSKYPRFAQNALMNYKQFSISGLISAEEDFNRQFLDEKAEEYERSMGAYDDNVGAINLVRNDTAIPTDTNPSVNMTHDTYPHRHMFWEREFREKAMAWLNDGEPKLFRSMTEGNMIVMLDDISLSPREGLDRMVYDFNATMYEVGDGYDIKKLREYNIISYRNDEEEDLYKGTNHLGDAAAAHRIVKIGQYIMEYPAADNDVLDLIRYQNTFNTTDDVGSLKMSRITMTDLLNAWYAGDFKGRKLSQGSIRLNDLKIQFTNKPYWMKTEVKDGTRVLTYIDPKTTNYEDQLRQEKEVGNLLFGYCFKIWTDDGSNGAAPGKGYVDIFVNPQGYYQIPSDIIIVGLQFYQRDNFWLDYKMSYDEGVADGTIVTKIQRVRKVVGQYASKFKLNRLLGEEIRKQYRYREYVNNGTLAIEELMDEWNAISLDVKPFSMFQIQYTDKGEWEDRMVGETGVYNLSKDHFIKDIRFTGLRMALAKHDNRPFINIQTYVLDSSVTSNYFAPSLRDDVEDYWYTFVMSNNEPQIVKTDDVVRLGILSDIANDEVFSYWIDREEIANNQELYGYLSLNNIKDPQYNTIYKVVDGDGMNPIYVIYYLDQSWYLVEFDDDNKETAIVKMPIQGLINYKGTVLKYTYKNTIDTSSTTDSDENEDGIDPDSVLQTQD